MSARSCAAVLMAMRAKLNSLDLDPDPVTLIGSAQVREDAAKRDGRGLTADHGDD